MSVNLRSSMFFTRSNQPKDIVITGNDVIMQVQTDKDRSSLQKACSQTFKTYGKFHGKPLIDAVTTSITDATPVTVPPTPDTVPPPTLDLALRSPVEDIKRLLLGLNRVDTHAVLTFLTLHYASQQAPLTPPVDRLQSTNLHFKVLAASAFSLPVAEWPGKLQEQAAKAAPSVLGSNCFRCTCACGCSDISGGYSLCFGCQKFLCGCCFPRDHTALRPRRPRCHHCAGTDKLPLAAHKPITPLDGLHWYFNYPWNGSPLTNDVCPVPWVTPNRNPDLDPRLVDVVKITKQREIENNTRRVLPIHWETALEVTACLADTDGATTLVGINLFTFLMNKQWAQRIPLAYITNWMPQNLRYTGDVLRPPVVFHLTPSPPTPDYAGDALLDSTVSFQEVETDEEDQDGLSTTTDHIVSGELAAKRRRAS